MNHFVYKKKQQKANHKFQGNLYKMAGFVWKNKNLKIVEWLKSEKYI